MKIAQLDQMNTDNFVDFSGITPDRHRAFNSGVLAYISTMPKMKLLTLNAITSVDRNYSLDTNLESNEVITGAICMLECKVANNNFSVGDLVTAPTPYPSDNGRTLAQGIGLQYTNVNNSTVKVLINDDVVIMAPYSAVTDALVEFISIRTNIQNWKVKVFLTYI